MFDWLKKLWKHLNRSWNNYDWYGFVVNYQPMEYSGCKDWKERLNITHTDMKNINAIMNYVHVMVEYKDEPIDYWQSATETRNSAKGDCDDFAILFASLAIAAGYNVRVCIGKLGGKGHAWALWYHDGKVEIYEPQAREVFDQRKTDDYMPIYSFNRENIWKHC